ncbi:MAG: hypothetical protein GVY04_11900 [Cyanobacteria bacterium]|jgi:hypothetical protein|nr:hypothetical protein [Cyanobacteria bacterium GSL.Bin1]
MGDINFNIAKDVNLNKQVQMDINKNVDVNVNNPDQLATAEADAEAFGPNALAEVDAYTLVTPPTEMPGEVFEDSGAIDVVGNTTDFGLEGSVEIVGGDGDLPEDITVNLSNSDGELPDADDINAGGSLASLDGSATTDTPISVPDAPLSFDNDLNLSFVQEIAVGNPATAEAEYSIDNDVVVSFGNQDLDLNGDGNSVDDELTLTIPAGSTFFVEELANGEIELEFASAPEGDPILWSHDDLEGDLAPDSPIDTPFEVTAFVQDAQDAGLEDIEADWAFQAGIFDRIEGIPGEGGTAFAYAESTSALDLNPNAGGDLVA